MAEGTKIDRAIGVIITPVGTAGIAPFTVTGEVGYKVFDNEKYFYCNGKSFSANIVNITYENEEAAEARENADNDQKIYHAIVAKLVSKTLQEVV